MITLPSVAVGLIVFAAPTFSVEILEATQDVAQVFVVPPSLVRAVIRVESGFNPQALSSCGARGLMQVMPFNAKKLGLSGPDELWIPRRNILAGVRLLAALLKHYDGDVIAALVAYNSGPKAKLARVPANGETPAYVSRILLLWRNEMRREESLTQAAQTLSLSHAQTFTGRSGAQSQRNRP